MTNSATQLDAGTTIGGYRVNRLLAEGGMAVVYEASHLILPRRAALKVMHAHLTTTPQAAQRILQEACILEAFSHPGAVRIFEVGVLEDHRPWIAMELVGGEPLSAMLTRVGQLPVPAIMKMMSGVIDVVSAAHRSGIVHRDLKPENVLVTGEHLDDLRVIDWGIARQPVDHRLTLDNFTLGTPTYMAPEQARGHAVDGRADIYALGVMAYEAAVGHPPFAAENPISLVLKHLNQKPEPVRSLRPDLPAGLAWLIDSMLEKSPTDRPTGAMVAACLARLAKSALVVDKTDESAYEDFAYEDPTETEYDELTVNTGEYDDDGDSIIDLEPVSVAILAERELDERIARAHAQRAADNQLARRRSMTRRWTPMDLLAQGSTAVVPRHEYDSVSGAIDPDRRRS